MDLLYKQSGSLFRSHICPPASDSSSDEPYEAPPRPWLSSLLPLLSQRKHPKPAESLTHPAGPQVILAWSLGATHQVRALLKVERVTKIDQNRKLCWIWLDLYLKRK